LRAVGQSDLEILLSRLEEALTPRPKPWPFAATGIVECAWFPNLAAARLLGLAIDQARFPAVLGWLAAMRGHPVFAADAKRGVPENVQQRLRAQEAVLERRPDRMAAGEQFPPLVCS
jgi:hypothetical protein